MELLEADQPDVHGNDLRASMRAGLVLKAPRCHAGRVAERGVLLLKNTERIDSFRRSVEIKSLLERFTLVLEPSWSAYANTMLLAYALFREHPILVMSPCSEDFLFLERLNSNLRPIPIGASDWVDPSVFRPLPNQSKSFDAVMIARWSLAKRHHLLFRALKDIGDPAYRVALIASTATQDADRRNILAAIEKRGLAGQITVFEDLQPDGVNEILNQSKVNLLLSRQEGSNRSLFEGFFAGVPGLAFSNHVGIPKKHFNPQTGRLIAEQELSRTLLYFRDRWRDFDPRSWALANIAPEVSTSNLNAALMEMAQQRSEPWTEDIVCKCNCPNLLYYPSASAHPEFPAMGDLVSKFPRDSGNSAAGMV